MRNTARWAATLALTATAVCGPLTGAALATPDAAPASLYAPRPWCSRSATATAPLSRLRCAPSP